MTNKVLVVCTGGTLGMVITDSGLEMYQEGVESQIRKIDAFNHPEMPDLTFKEFPLIDSSQMDLSYWNNLAREIYQQYDEFDGFVILHGTDTMAYTGAALSFMLENLGKPVILTGAQTPLSCAINDARENIINACYIAGQCKRLCQVAIYFNGELLAANRVTKVSTKSYKAYRSPKDDSPLGQFGASIEIFEDRLLKSPSPDSTLALTELEPKEIRTIRIMPTTTCKTLAATLNGADAVILESYGDGNLPTGFLSLFEEASAQGVILINRSQCLHSDTSSGIYEAGRTLESCGIISAGNQTIESITAKLNYLMTKNLDCSTIKKLMGKNLRGELTAVHAISPPKIHLHRSYSALISRSNSPLFFVDELSEESPLGNISSSGQIGATVNLTGVSTPPF